MDAEPFRYNDTNDTDKHALYDNGDVADGVAIKIRDILNGTLKVKIKDTLLYKPQRID